MENELHIDLGGTIFRLLLSSKGVDDGGYSWTDANIMIENRYFNYQTGAEFLTYSEIKEIYCQLTMLLDDKVQETTTLEFIEPDLQIALNPKHDLRNDPKYVYVKEGFEIEDVCAEFIFFLSLGAGYTDERYTLPLYRSDIEHLVEFIGRKIDEFDKS